MTEGELLAIAPRLVPLEPGLFVAQDRGAARVSYPADAHAAYALIEEHSFWFQHRNRCLLAAFEAFPPPGTLFDVGGGNGCVAQALARAGRDVVVIEPNLTGARQARARGLTPVVCATPEEAGFGAGSFPALGLFDVLEHCADDLAFLRGLRARLVAGGRLYVTVPAGPRLWSSEDVYAGHYRRYRRRALVGLLEAAGYDVELASCFFTPLPPLVFLLRALPERLGRAPRTSAQASAAEHAAGSPLGALAERVLSVELQFLRRGRGLPFGSSCLAVARASR